MEDSSKTKVLLFKVPNTLAFRDVSIFEFRIEKSLAGKNYADFLIEKVEALNGNQDQEPIKNQQNPSQSFPFGGSFLQSNIWGGEVRAT